MGIAQIEKFQTLAKKRIEKQRKKQKKAYAGFFDKAASDKNEKDTNKEDVKVESGDVKQTIEAEKQIKEDGEQVTADKKNGEKEVTEDWKHGVEDGKQEDQEEDK